MIILPIDDKQGTMGPTWASEWEHTAEMNSLEQNFFFTECLNGQSTNCGTFCCPTINSIDSTDTSGNLRDQCCRSQFGTIRSGCCSFLENQFSTCNGITCPDYANSAETRDDNGRLKNECCRYFRSGCCSTEENNSLQVL